MHFHIGPNVGIRFERDQRDSMPAGGKPLHELLMVDMAAGAAIDSSR